MLFALICTDKLNSVEIRTKNRNDHLEYLNSLGTGLKAAGPFVSDDGIPTGSLIIIEAESQIAAQEIANNDPYALAGLFDSVDIRPWKWLINNPEA